MLARVLRIIAVTSVVLFGFATSAFIAGETFDDPGGWKAVLMIGAWAVPLVALAVLALFWPDLATKVLTVALLAVVAVVLVDRFANVVNQDRWGPVDTIAIFAVAIPCGLLGVRRAVAAGWLLIGGAAAQVVLTFARFAGHEGPGFAGGMSGSSGVMILPYLILGVLFLSAAAAEHSESRHHSGGVPTVGPAH